MQNFNRATLIPANWRPEDVHYQLLAQQNIPSEFVDHCVAQFVLYWTERKKVEFSWGSKFVRHCIHEYRNNQTQQHVQQRNVAMTPDWQPSPIAINQLKDEGMNYRVLDSLLADFKVYWIERGDLCSTWSSKFVQFARQGAERVNASPQNRVTRDVTLVEHLTDRTWAD